MAKDEFDKDLEDYTIEDDLFFNDEDKVFIEVVDNEKREPAKDGQLNNLEDELIKKGVFKRDGIYVTMLDDVVNQDEGDDSRELTQEEYDYILAHNREVFRERLAEFYRVMRRYGYPVMNEVTRSLRALGEISLDEAVELEFFLSMQDDHRKMYFLEEINKHIEAMDEFSEITNMLRSTVLRIDSRRILARSHIEQSKQFTLPKPLVVKLDEAYSKLVEPMQNWQQEMQDATAAMMAVNAELDFFERDCGVSIDEAWEIVKQDAKAAINAAKNIKNFNTALGRTDGLLLFETVRKLRTALPPEVIKFLHNPYKKLRKVERDFKYEVEHFI